MQTTIYRRTFSKHDDLFQDLHPVLRRIYAARNIKSESELDYSLTRLYPFEQLKNISAAVRLLADAIQDNKKMLIVADFDADGATSCVVAKRGLELLGAKQVDYIVPNRFEFGYGLSPEIVEVAAEQQPDVLITVDNGISSIEGVAQARSKNMEVLITDHHLPGEQLPDASVIVNPNQKGDEFPSKNLAGVGVMFYILTALRACLRETNGFDLLNIKEPNLADLLDLVALGTVADVVPLDHNNRILVAQGLARIRAGKCCRGIQALFKVANRSLHNITSQDLAFVVAPRLNAAGRLTDMSLGIECLLCDDEQTAMQFARKLDGLNKERREIQVDMQQQALADIATLGLDTLEQIPSGLCLYNESWHQGIVGILAAKIKDKLHRPVIAFADDNHEYIKGSARSIQGVHIRDVLETIANQHPGIINKFGGHAMAAGLTIKRSDLSRFEALLIEVIDQFIDDEELDRTIYTDGELTANDLNINLAESIIKSGPWGQGFPEPTFDGEFIIKNSRIVGSNHLKLELWHDDQESLIDAIAFNTTDEDWPESTERIKTIYKLDINEFAGRRKLQLVLDFITPV